MKKKQTKLPGTKKLYWGQSQLAWLIGTKAFKKTGKDLNKKEIKKLVRRLLSIGGNSVCVAFEEPSWWSRILAERGESLSKCKVILQKGEPSNCHRNSAKLWRRNKNKYVLFKGYGLSEDGMWRQHWWLVRKDDGQIIETTTVRKIYFGIGYSSMSAESFGNMLKN